MAKKFTKEDDALLAELGVESKVPNISVYTPRQERIIAGFEEIQRFAKEHKRTPQAGEGRGVFEVIYALRLDRIRASNECIELLNSIDSGGLLGEAEFEGQPKFEGTTDEELLAALEVGVDADVDVTLLKHVRPRAEINAAEELAKRTPCEDFDRFDPVFRQVQEELNSGSRRTEKHRDQFEPESGAMYIVSGQKVLIAEMGGVFNTNYGRTDRRLRVIYDNGTESDLLLRSLQRALNRDEASRHILPPDAEALPLFSDLIEAEDSQSGHIYVLRSLSDHPFIAEHHELVHKIGVTSQDVKRRIAGAKRDPTFLLADVELVESYQLANINRSKLERLLHQFFAHVRMDLDLLDRFSNSVEPREWFLVPLPAIKKAVELLMSGEIEHCRYDSTTAQIIDARTGNPS